MNWKEAKKLPSAWEHIRIDLTGGGDTCRCVICKQEMPIESQFRTRQSLLTEVARKHFYKHKLDEAAESGVPNQLPDSIASKGPAADALRRGISNSAKATVRCGPKEAIAAKRESKGE